MLAAQISGTEVVVFGGHSGKFLGDGFIFNTKRKQIKHVLRTDHFKFSS